jgi:hypothetical protein
MVAADAWAKDEIPKFNYRDPASRLLEFIDEHKVKNLTLARGRFIKKVIAGALASLATLPTENCKSFIRCAVLRCGQWALDGRNRHTSLTDFRRQLQAMVAEMMASVYLLGLRMRESSGIAHLLNVDAARINLHPIFAQSRERVSLVVTSPPYPGVHVLYHRWQVDGRRETPAPYWIAGCNDGQGASFYNFGDRRRSAADNYFQKSLETLRAVRNVMVDGGLIVQMIAFNEPAAQLPRYLQNMRDSGFLEIASTDLNANRIWRDVPNRKWHATFRGKTHSAREVVLIHRAV